MCLNKWQLFQQHSGKLAASKLEALCLDIELCELWQHAVFISVLIQAEARMQWQKPRLNFCHLCLFSEKVVSMAGVRWVRGQFKGVVVNLMHILRSWFKSLGIRLADVTWHHCFPHICPFHQECVPDVVQM